MSTQMRVLARVIRDTAKQIMLYERVPLNAEIVLTYNTVSNALYMQIANGEQILVCEGNNNQC